MPIEPGREAKACKCHADDHEDQALGARCQADIRGEADALSPRVRVADQERAGQGDHERRASGRTGSLTFRKIQVPTPMYRIASPERSSVESRNPPKRVSPPVARASAAVDGVEDGAGGQQDAPRRGDSRLRRARPRRW